MLIIKLFKNNYIERMATDNNLISIASMILGAVAAQDKLTSRLMAYSSIGHMVML